MSEAELLFKEIGKKVPGVKEGKMFGCLCLKTPKGKAAAMLWKDELVVKLEKSELERIMKLKGSKFFEPMDNRPMKEWVQVSLSQSPIWPELIRKSLDYVSALNK